MRALAGALAAVTVVAAGVVPWPAWALGTDDRNGVVDLTFPVAGSVTYRDDYDANRAEGARRHQATDLYGVKQQRVHAAVGGTVCWAPGIGEPMPAYGYMITVCADDGIAYSYVHLNNDSPGTDDGRGGAANAYAPGVARGVRVERGQWIAYLGDSGNGEDTPPHLHFQMDDARLEDHAITVAPWQPDRRNPFPSLQRAQEQGDLPPGAASGSSVLRIGDRGAAVAAWQADLNSARDAGLAVDGAFGPGTHAATVAFQDDRGLDPDGAVGPATRRAMTQALEDPAPAAPSGDPTAYGGRPLRLEDPAIRGDDVRAWQQRLRDRGWAIGVDGIFGPQSDAVARAFQRDQGVRVDGIVGPVTWALAFSG